MPVLGVIPARLGSTRLPRKPLQPLGGAPLIHRVIKRVRSLGVVDELVVATDSEEVAGVAEWAGARWVLTSRAHRTGTERVAEAAALPAFQDFDLIVNVQGAAPFVPGAALPGAIAGVRGGDDVGSAAAPLAPADAGDPARVKVVLDRNGRALYFSRAAIPLDRKST